MQFAGGGTLTRRASRVDLSHFVGEVYDVVRIAVMPSLYGSPSAKSNRAGFAARSGSRRTGD